MYQIILDEGIVLRTSGGVQVAPCQSASDAAFQAYVAWVEAGNLPEEIQTRTPSEAP